MRALTRKRRRGPAALMAICLASSVLGLPAVASADVQDDQFLAAVAAQGITGDPEQLISAARNMCNVVGGMGAVAPFYRLMASQSLSPVQASAVFAAGANAYCPDKAGLIAQPSRMPF